MPFQKGESGNPDGRPPGSRNKLAEAFVRDVLVQWEQSGPGVIKKLCDERPYDFAKLVATIIPKNFNVKVNDYEHYSDDELDHRISRLRAVIERAETRAAGGGNGEGSADTAQSSRLLSALSEAG